MARQNLPGGRQISPHSGGGTTGKCRNSAPMPPGMRHALCRLHLQMDPTMPASQPSIFHSLPALPAALSVAAVAGAPVSRSGGFADLLASLEIAPATTTPATNASLAEMPPVTSPAPLLPMAASAPAASAPIATAASTALPDASPPSAAIATPNVVAAASAASVPVAAAVPGPTEPLAATPEPVAAKSAPEVKVAPTASGHATRPASERRAARAASSDVMTTSDPPSTASVIPLMLPIAPPLAASAPGSAHSADVAALGGRSGSASVSDVTTTAHSSAPSAPPPSPPSDPQPVEMPHHTNESSRTVEAIAAPGMAATASQSGEPQVAPQEGASSVSTSAPSAPHQANTTPPVAPLSDQVVPAMLHVVRGESGSRVSLELNPQSLGPVVIAVERPSDGGTKVTLTASRPETLSLLQQDSTQLGHALDRAGVAPEGRSIVFHLTPATSSGSSGDSSSQTGSGGSFGTGGNAADLSHQHGGQDPRRSGQSASYAFSFPAPETTSPEEAAAQTRAVVRGMDITA